MKKDKKRRGKKSFSHRRKKARAQTSSSVSSETSCSVIANPSKQHNHRNHLISSVSSPSTSRSLSVGKRSTQIGFVTSADLPPEENLKTIASYIHSREEMVHQMFASLDIRELYELLPKNLKKMELKKLQNLCVKELTEMSKKNICTILKGKNFIESGESEEEKNEMVVVANIKTSKAEIAVADSTTEMTGANLPASQCNITENVSATNTRQESRTVVHSDFTIECRTSFISNHHEGIFVSEDMANPNDQVDAVVTTQNDGELEDGEVVSDQEESLNSGNKDTLNKDQNCDQYITVSGDLFTGNAHSSLASVLKNSEKDSIHSNDGAQKENRLRMLELELRARAIEALIKRGDSLKQSS